jgi:nucleoside-diphosphate-sugar epimerase
MRILVTGGSGLIGCHAVAQLLDAGHEVRAFVRHREKLERALEPLGRSGREVEIVLGDLGRRESIAEAIPGCEGILHCAGLFSPERQDEALLVQTNVVGTRQLLGAAAEYHSRTSGLTRLVYVSSMLALFPPKGAVMSAEEDVARPRSMYARTKAEAERIARGFQETLPLTILYPAAVHGPNDPTFSIGPQLVARAIQDRKVLVTEGGLAYTDVRELASLIARVFSGESEADRLMGPSFFVTHERYRSLLETISGREFSAQRVPGWMLRMMGRLGDLAQRFGRSPQLNYEAAEVLTRSVPLDDREARRILGRNALSDEQSFRDLVDWMQGAGHLAP